MHLFRINAHLTHKRGDHRNEVFQVFSAGWEDFLAQNTVFLGYGNAQVGCGGVYGRRHDSNHFSRRRCEKDSIATKRLATATDSVSKAAASGRGRQRLVPSSRA